MALDYHLQSLDSTQRIWNSGCPWNSHIKYVGQWANAVGGWGQTVLDSPSLIFFCGLTWSFQCTVRLCFYRYMYIYICLWLFVYICPFWGWNSFGHKKTWLKMSQTIRLGGAPSDQTNKTALMRDAESASEDLQLAVLLARHKVTQGSCWRSEGLSQQSQHRL